MGERTIGLQMLFKKCSEKYRDKRIKNIIYSPDDRGHPQLQQWDKIYSMAYSKKKTLLKELCGPDWTFWFWPSASITSFEEMKNEIIEKSSTQPTINKVGWYGNIYSPLPDVIEHKTRPLLQTIGTKYPDLFDIVHVSPVDGVIDNTISNFLSLPDLLKYKCLLDIGGNGYSGRLKYLLFSKRPLLLVDREYIEYFHDELIPYKHYVPVRKDLSDLVEKTKWVLRHYEECLIMAQNAYGFACYNFTQDKLVERIYQVYKTINPYTELQPLEDDKQELETIPKCFVQTSYEKLPKYIEEKFNSFASQNWTYSHYDDSEIIQYFQENPLEEFPNVAEKFYEMPSGPHRADLFRYYYLYIQGGVYVDSDAMITTNIENIIQRYQFVSVQGGGNNIFQGLLCSTPKNEIVYKALIDVYNIDVEALKKNYHLICENLYSIVHNNSYDFNIKLYHDKPISDAEYGIFDTINNTEHLIAVHYYKTKVIPP